MTAAPWTTRRSPEKRFAKTSASPRSFNPSQRTVEVVASAGSPVDRGLYTERLKISPSSVDLSRMQKGGIAVLDSHSQAGLGNIIGKVVSIRFDGGLMLATIKFAETRAGDDAMAMVCDGMIPGSSIGYVVRKWRFEDSDGRVLDPEQDRIPSDGSVTAWAVRFELMELSLVSVPADSEAVFRSLDVTSLAAAHRAALARMAARTRMLARQRMIDRMRGR